MQIPPAPATSARRRKTSGISSHCVFGTPPGLCEFSLSPGRANGHRTLFSAKCLRKPKEIRGGVKITHFCIDLPPATISSHFCSGVSVHYARGKRHSFAAIARTRARARAMCVRARPYIFRFGGYIARQLEVNNERSCPKNYVKKQKLCSGWCVLGGRVFLRIMVAHG